jgi:hypothetical protein
VIVVATHNDSALLVEICLNLSRINLYNQKVLIVDTNSDDIVFKENFSKLSKVFKNFLFTRMDYKCWDSGAYINAYLNFPNEEKFIFLQDSLMIPDRSNFIETSIKLLDKYDVVPWTNFQYKFDNEEQRKWAEDGLALNTYPTDAIFGPIFSVNRKTLDELPKDWLKTPSNKNEGCAMERRWSGMFHSINAKKYYIEYSINGDAMSYSREYICKNYKNRE